MLSSTERFSTRVENYIKYRPSYPAEVLELMRVRCGLAATSHVADVGSGTGILTELLLETGATVFAVEPNKEMRAAAERLLSDYGRFRSIAGTAEATTLPDASVDLITASQAFHWFDIPKSRRELARILRPRGWVALIWNERPVDAGAFLDEYDALLRRHAADYDRVTNMRADEAKSATSSDAHRGAPCLPTGRRSILPGSRGASCRRRTRRSLGIPSMSR
jgi:ubiquinone/menaquinone biosynthesis C-methylase UbiE